jgi:hypothetical protein
MSESLRLKLEDRIRRKEAEAAELRRQLAVVEENLRTQREFLVMIVRDSVAPVSREPFRRSSAIGKAYDVLKSRGQPMHISAIIEAMGRQDTKEFRRNLSQQLSAYFRRGEVFSRPATGVFGLRSWESDRSSTTNDDGTLPAVSS